MGDNVAPRPRGVNMARIQELVRNVSLQQVIVQGAPLEVIRAMVQVGPI